MEDQEHSGTQSLGRVMAICAWILAILLMTLFFSQWSKENHMNTKAKMITVDGVEETLIKRNVYNQYRVEGLLNGHPVIFLLDTGATSVVVPEKLAKKLKLTFGPEAKANTAGGTVTVYQTRIKEIVIGNITLHNVAANINPTMDDDEILLGMSALKRVTFYQQGDNLVITNRKLDDRED